MKNNRLINLINYTKLLLNNICINFSPTIFASSLSIEDMVLTDIILKEKFSIEIFTINTGFLHLETLKIIKYIKKKYNYKIFIIYPNRKDINKYFLKFGIYAFYKKNYLRKKCCYIRKVKPLKKILKKYRSWITGRCIEQSLFRSILKIKEKDIINNNIKFNPLLFWQRKDIYKYIIKNKIPYNILYNKNYESIGCKPCTRSILDKENIRSGRWWWEKNNLKECGIHYI
ncbi:phosphoadenylyl-sulfate reductase [Candidatus Zinderia endosymbiont of Aphrophora alni]|uniref:phosphoadenylyl-sulfate reductase n=1 Tax=Candidatus Zinderia endosymbiont of Aphrophora alni TaxID=3077951 RepID=UPI0030CAAC13